MQDDGTRAAITEQLNQHALLTRKANNMKESSSSEESSDDDDLDETSDRSDQDDAVKLLKKAKDKTVEVLDGDEELPASGVLSLPFHGNFINRSFAPLLALNFLTFGISFMVMHLRLFMYHLETLSFHRSVD